MNSRSGMTFLIAALLLLGGCAQPQRVRVDVYDATASVELSARDALLKGLAESAKRMERGTVRVLIPITDDSLAATPGLIKRYHAKASDEREAYDQDLLDVHAQVERDLAELFAQFTSHPAQRTDLFGALRLAAEELARPRAARVGDVRIFSDLIEDSAEFNFIKDPRLADEASARRFARSLAEARPLKLNQIPVALGIVRSTDLAALPPARRDAIQAFWVEYLSACGARVTLVSDGLSLLTEDGQ